MALIRKAVFEDLDFLVETDLLGEGYTFDPNEAPMSENDLLAHREHIASFLTDPNQGCWVVVDPPEGVRVGMIMARFRDRLHEPDTEENRFLFQFLDESIFPPDGRFCEVFQLWVHPSYRRQGLATQLKRVLEEESKQRGIHMVYTHTEEKNQHVLEMNFKLGYQEVRRGQLWDSVTRVSLVKWLDGD